MITPSAPTATSARATIAGMARLSTQRRSPARARPPRAQFRRRQEQEGVDAGDAERQQEVAEPIAESEGRLHLPAARGGWQRTAPVHQERKQGHDREGEKPQRGRLPAARLGDAEHGDDRRQEEPDGHVPHGRRRRQAAGDGGDPPQGRPLDVGETALESEDHEEPGRVVGQHVERLPEEERRDGEQQRQPEGVERPGAEAVAEDRRRRARTCPTRGRRRPTGRTRWSPRTALPASPAASTRRGRTRRRSRRAAGAATARPPSARCRSGSPRRRPGTRETAASARATPR